MSNVIKLRKGLNLRLKGDPKKQTGRLCLAKEYAISPLWYEGVSPKIIVKEGDKIEAGDVLFVNKANPDMKYCSPMSGTVKQVERGERRKVLAIHIAPTEEIQYKQFGKVDLQTIQKDELLTLLMECGLLSAVKQLPYDVCINTPALPKGIYVSAFRDMPLSADFEYELEGNEADFQTGLSALSKLAETHLSIHVKQTASALKKAKDVTLHVFDGPCPAGNASVQINHIDPVNKGELVWMVDPMHVIFIGRRINQGIVDMRRRIAVVGSLITSPGYVETIPGTSFKEILEGNMVRTDHVRLINGNPLTGQRAEMQSSLSIFSSEVTAIPEGDNIDEVLGWIMPRSKQFSVSRSYLPWLLSRSRKYDVDARIKGGRRNMIMSGEYDKVFPMNIYPEYLIKAIIAGDIDRQEQLGIYEVSPADFALCEYVDSSKLELQRIVREGLDKLRKENM